ncbi:MAG: signal peptidase II [Winogradskyella sp.]|uniref:signal peptidase II n=1 Tax=Winogradskyella sp. TaxID=1883156 RepID=UPI0025F9DB4D|nr:signal peptidase II [Winogradskyella sp.]NRB83804.1 signal peptidase II [Winogradskyella sp.]
MKRNLFIVLLIVFNIAIDQISKVWVRANFDYGETKSLIGEKFIMQYVENQGAFLGMGSDMHPTLKLILLLILPTIVLGYVIYYIIKNKELDRMSLIAFCCIVGGGIANVFDRITRGEVTDFFFINLGGVFKTGIFNIADVSVTTGMLILLFSGLFSKKKSTEVIG